MSDDLVIFAGTANPRLAVAIAGDGLFLPGARERLTPAVRQVFVTDTVTGTEKDWPQLRVVSVAPLIAGALERSVVGGWRRHESTTFS
jgi:ribose-phosphate pyrophosphokinase